MSIGSEFGTRLGEIAQEKVSCEYDLAAAKKFIIDGIGCSDVVATKLVHGKDLVLWVDDPKACTLSCGTRDQMPEGFTYPELDSESLATFWVKDIYDVGQQIVKHLSGIIHKIINAPSKSVSFNVFLDVSELIEASANEDSETLKESIYNQIARQMDRKEGDGTPEGTALHLVKSIDLSIKWANEAAKKLKCIQDLEEASILPLGYTKLDLAEDIEKMLSKTTYEDARHTLIDLHNITTEILYRMQTMRHNKKISTMLDDYIKASEELEKTLLLHLWPVQIAAKQFDAGWLSPLGAYFALNGTVANQLHLLIADKLYAQGTIPRSKKLDKDSAARDHWLENNGWVKIHHDNILFYPTKEFMHPTRTQITKIAEYAKAFYGGNIHLGYHDKDVKASSLTQMDDVQIRALFTDGMFD